MVKKFTLIIASLLLVFVAAAASGCDPSIYDAGGESGYGQLFDEFLKDVTISDILDAKECYNKLLTDLTYMKTHCCTDQQLAAMQAYTIMSSYGMADMAKETSAFTFSQIRTKAELYDAIKLINYYAGNVADISVSEAYEFVYSEDAVVGYTDSAIAKCNQMLSFLP